VLGVPNPLNEKVLWGFFVCFCLNTKSKIIFLKAISTWLKKQSNQKRISGEGSFLWHHLHIHRCFKTSWPKIISLCRTRCGKSKCNSLWMAISCCSNLYADMTKKRTNLILHLMCRSMKKTHKFNITFDVQCLEKTKQHRWGSIQWSLGL
jgi:hypothetical protein